MRCELCLSEHAGDVLCGNVHWSQTHQLSSADLLSADPQAPSPAAAPDAPADLVGQTLGRYRVVRRLGSGGMGTVYQAEQTRIGARVALKVLHPHMGQDAGLRARFYAEAKTVNVVGHPNIVRIFDINEAPGGIHYFVMEYLEGVPMSQLPRPLEPGLLTHLLGQACEALEAAHSAGVVHRDLKPDNLFVLQRDGMQRPSLKVLDFGVAKARLQRTVTLPGIVKGKPLYMSPEQARGERLDARSDLFSMGLILYESLTGKRAFDKGDEVASMYAICDEQLRRPDRIPKPVWDVMEVALAKRATDRFRDAQEMAEQLVEVVPPAKDAELARLVSAHFPERLRELARLDRSAEEKSKAEKTRVRPVVKPLG
jgi:eukaryotic-like serine/threonine-protein kinase